MTGGDQQGPEEQRSEDKPFQFTDKRKVDPSAAQPHPAGEAAGAELDAAVPADHQHGDAVAILAVDGG